ncbi:DUF5615 family PIN-like protein [Dyadobacter psychrotolerans]|uniref:DUF5615 domain-containing protein n=1 Tax=Dyadobacter psychrotolerans TaxID=2541721 RepID=A0A4R5D5S7_9BACT|nr:DUF5615 family PIN-like protein [Dyadobacter psychrotolerans]TDE08839.1 hypothetical protein E0F88_31835 [Dyadobacter psychrotolerans]
MLMLILDAHIPPGLALWITSTFNLECYSAVYLNLRDSNDRENFFAAREKNAIVITKDDDFVSLLNRHGAPPKVIWLTCGNTSKNRLREIFEKNLFRAIQLLETTDLVEITGH